MSDVPEHPAPYRKPAVVSATAALAALSVALLLTMPAVAATGQSFRGTSEPDTTRLALAQLRESLNQAARALAGIEHQHVGQAAVAPRPSARPTIQAAALAAARLPDSLCVTAPPLREALLNLPPPTR